MKRLIFVLFLLPVLALGQTKNSVDELSVYGKAAGGTTWTKGTTVYTNVCYHAGDSVRAVVAFEDTVNVAVYVQEGFASGTKFVSYKETFLDSVQSTGTPTVAAPYYRELVLQGKLSAAAVTYRLKYVFSNVSGNHTVAANVAARKFKVYLKQFGMK